MRNQSAAWRSAGETIGFVPTMGNLHEGHLQLIKVAQQHTQRCVVSIYVNPLQFPPGTDFETYPRTLDEDLQKLAAYNVDVIFTPNDDMIYPDGMSNTTAVVVPNLSDILCGAHRQGHFQGVATVVQKLFNIVQPDYAVFGEKDYQQLQVIRKMTQDLNVPVNILSLDTVREADGLAMSSRNQYLNEQERQKAARIYQGLNEIKAHLLEGQANFRRIEADLKHQLKREGFRPDYVAICNAHSLQPANESDKQLRVLIAAYLGKARLIDNVAIDLPVSE